MQSDKGELWYLTLRSVVLFNEGENFEPTRDGMWTARHHHCRITRPDPVLARVWFIACELNPGDGIPAKIEEGVEHSRVLVLCMSAQEFGSD